MRTRLAVLLGVLLAFAALPTAQGPAPPNPDFPAWITPPSFAATWPGLANCTTTGTVLVGGATPACSANPSVTTVTTTGDITSSAGNITATAGAFIVAAGQGYTFGAGGAQGRLYSPNADGRYNLVNGALTAGVELNVITDLTLWVKSRAGADTAIVKAATVNATTAYQFNGSSFGTATVGPSSISGTTSTAAFVMAGLGGSFTTQTGRANICMSGNMDNLTANDGGQVQISYGTTVPVPTKNAPLQGTQVGPQLASSSSVLAAAAVLPYGACWVVTTLTPGTTYWIDTAYVALTGGTLVLTQASMSAFDIP